jgi:integrase
MPDRERVYRRLLEEKVTHMMYRGLSADYIQEFRRTGMQLYKWLSEAGLQTHPRKISEKEIHHLLQVIPGTQRNKKYYITYLRMFLKFHGNTVLERMALTFSHDMSIHKRWLNPKQKIIFHRVIEKEATPEEQLIGLLEYGMGFRRVEIRRLRIQDVDLNNNIIHIIGKGRMGGKIRTIPLHPSFPAVFQYYLKNIREPKIQRAQRLANGAVVPVPDNVLLALRFEHLKPILGPKASSTVDFALGQLSRLCGFRISNHDLRRTFARNLYESGVDLEIIRQLLGHETIKQTEEYIGINLDHMTEGMATYAKAVPLNFKQGPEN